MKKIEFSVAGIGAWGSSFENWAQLKQLLNGEQLEAHGLKGPKPDVIPANERRRAPLPVRLAVESSWQAVQASPYDPKELSCVFVSGLGDTQLTDYMCKVLAGENKALSPTKFHNSVHNAAAGYWTICTSCTQAANSVAGFDESVPLTLLEALIQADAEQRPMLITFYDAPSSEILKGLLKNEHSFSVSMVIVPSSLSDNKADFSVAVEQQPCSWPEAHWSGELNDCYQTNPVAKTLLLLSLLASDLKGSNNMIKMPLSEGTSLAIKSVVSESV